LRITSSVTGVFPRVAIKDTKVGHINIRKGDLVNLNFIGSHNNELYFENALEFKPERWLDKKESTSSETFTYIPFSAGNRNCKFKEN
jgi:cytochrome P450